MTLLQNRYLLGEELGRGAFGKTYLATDTHSPSNRKCVVKELIWSGDPEMADQVRERFRREAILLESLGRDSQGGHSRTVCVLQRERAPLPGSGMD